MKQIRLRVFITAEDAVNLETAQARLTEILNATGTEHMPNGDASTEANGCDLAGATKGPRVFWQTADVKQGSDRSPETAPRRSSVRLGDANELRARKRDAK